MYRAVDCPDCLVAVDVRCLLKGAVVLRHYHWVGGLLRFLWVVGVLLHVDWDREAGGDHC